MRMPPHKTFSSMSGFLGCISREECVNEVFYGTDYHSHLGTKRAGMAFVAKGKFMRSIHSLEDGYFRNKFECELPKFASANMGIGVISDSEAQPIIITSPLGRYAVVTVARIDNIEELLNSMQLFREQCEAETRNGERSEQEQPTVEEWLQNIMLLTDMDQQDDGGGKVTLMTVHSAKGLEYKYVYIAGMEENLFPSQRALETPDGIEEERRLFYVALTRAKCEAVLSFCEMRFKWGNMEFSQPSRFLSEIDPQFVDSDCDLSRRNLTSPREDDGRGFDDFDGCDRSGAARRTTYGQRPYGGTSTRQGYAAPHAEQRRDGRTAIEELRHRYDVRYQQQRAEGSAAPKAPDQRLVSQPPRTENLRRIPVTPRNDAAPAAPCGYAVGERVEHPKFGAGTIVRIESITTDHKIVVDFGSYGEKTLLARFAKLRKL